MVQGGAPVKEIVKLLETHRLTDGFIAFHDISYT
jgi:hypothetical protein